MPKSKKAKTSHHHHTRDRPLTQAEIWDDSALIRSWDEAVKEYEYYHSIHARGEDVEEVLRNAEMEEEGDADGADVPARQQPSGPPASKPVVFGPTAPEDDEVEEGEVDEGEIRNEEAMVESARDGTIPVGLRQRPNTTSKGMSSEKLESFQLPPGSQTGDQAPPASAGAAPSLHPQQDQTLENIKMAYWWAGYYSGLYEGQRQAAGG